MMLAACARSTVAAPRPALPARSLSTEASGKVAPPKKQSTKLWGGRFARDTDESVKAWIDSVPVDTHLVDEDLWGSMSHVSMLTRQKIIPFDQGVKIIAELRKLQDEWHAGTWTMGQLQDDVHMDVEATLIKRIGMETAGRMHTCRSRNDQVVLDSKLYARKRQLELRQRTLDMVEAFLERAEPLTAKVMPSYTHFQHAQPVSVAFWLSHYAAVFLRDVERLKNTYQITDLNPLGAGAIAATSFPIDRELTTRLMGFQRVHVHSMDATSARDFMLDSLHCSSSIAVTLSRLAEELIMWSSYEFQTTAMDDGFAMGSSMMPQKKNPGVLELVRGRMGRILGYLTGGFTMVKGLPAAYNRDFHEDKELLVANFDIICPMTSVIPALIRSTTLHLERMASLTDKNFACATELANYLVGRHDIPFREAHHVVGSLVGMLYRSGRNFTDLAACLKHIKDCGVNAPDHEIQAVLDPTKVMMSYNALGGTGEKAVKSMLKSMRDEHASRTAELQKDLKRVQGAREAVRGLAANITSLKNVDELARALDKLKL